MTEKLESNNKRIAKNTLLLYFRMLFTMGVSLYASRVVLNVLGIEDYGIYNVVGGFVVMLGFLNSAMTSSSQRFITFELGKGKVNRLELVFNTSIYIHFAICFLVIIVAETVGLWFLHNKMTIPKERIDAAFWVYQFSILSVIVSIMSVPYNAFLIAHERMRAFAYISVLEAVLKLFIVYLLLLFDVDRLILYAGLMFLVLLNSRIIYGWYCKKHFTQTRIRLLFDKSVFKEMSGFAGWSLIGDVSAVAYTQGVNLLLNVFFGPTANAARGISVQVQSAVNNFCTSFQMAINPQITKCYAVKEYAKMAGLIYISSKFSFFLLLILSLPIIISADTILVFWLRLVPEHTVNFVRLMLFVSLVDALANPLIIAAKATGDIKEYQLKVATIVLMIVPISWFLLRSGFAPEIVFIVHLIIVIIAQIARIIIIHKMILFSIQDYINAVLKRIIPVLLLCGLISYSLYNTVNVLDLLDVLWVSSLSVLSTILTIYLVGLTINERNLIRDKACFVVSKFLTKK